MCDRTGMTSLTHRPIAIDLYAGAGGLSLGMEQAGFDVVAAAELDPVAALVHLFNFPSCELLVQDLTLATGAQLLAAAERGWSRLHPGEPFPGVVDAIVGGPPCQGFSVGGLRDPEDPRNQQLLNFVRLVLEVRPRSFCLENVAGLLESGFDEIRELALSRLIEAGYTVSGFTATANARDFGVPQNRRRVIILGALDGIPRLRRASAARVTVADAFRGLPDIGRHRSLLSDDVAALSPGELVSDRHALGVFAARLSGVDEDPEDYSHPRVWNRTFVTNSRRTVHQRKTVRRFARTVQGDVERVSRLYRLDPASEAHTLRAGTGSDRGSHTSPRPIHPYLNRVITVREAARLHAYPDWFRFHTTNWHGHREVGNSVPPLLARAAGQALMAAMGLTPMRPSAELSLGDSSWLRLSATHAISTLRPLGVMNAPESAALPPPFQPLCSESGAPGSSSYSMTTSLASKRGEVQRMNSPSVLC
jgi:DNA (cytosine-5)-methyltransferase 1